MDAVMKSEYNMKINAQKTKVLVYSRNVENQVKIILGINVLQKVQKYGKKNSKWLPKL